MKVFEKIMYPLLVIILVWVTYVSRTHTSYFESQLVAEDGLVSWAMFWTILFASFMCLYRAIILKPFKRGNYFTLMLVTQGFIFFFFAMDSMSWLQHEIGFKTPMLIASRNIQGKMNFYDLVIFNFRLSDVVFTLVVKILATLYFLVFPFVYDKINFLKSNVNQYAIPIPRYTQVGAYLALCLFMLIIPLENRYIIFEFCFYWILVLMMYHPLNSEVFSRKSIVR